MVSVRKKPYIIPSYNLTGDLLSYLKCPLQYRYYNKAALPPSKPVQLWFGEFIHGVMEEAYVRWSEDTPEYEKYKRFPWNWRTDIREIELLINQRLRARGLHSYPGLFCPYSEPTDYPGKCPDKNHPHQQLVSRRTEAAINTWGHHLFPLIDQVEIDLKGTRPMPGYQENTSRSNYYGISGVADVISSIKVHDAPSGNLISHFLDENTEVQNTIHTTEHEEYEILIDYKGSRRPPFTEDEQGPTEWHHHEWQLLTYAGLRRQNPEAKPVIAGIIFYLNELYPSSEDLKEFQKDVTDNSTDVLPNGRDLTNLQKWNGKDTNILTRQLKEKRSIRIIPITDEKVQESFRNFDHVVQNIENSVLTEIGGTDIPSCWSTNYNEKTCTACDAKTFCPNSRCEAQYSPQVP